MRAALARILCALVPLAGALALATGAQAGAVHACGVARPGHERCLELIRTTATGRRLILAPSQVRASARTQARAVSANTSPGAPSGYSPATFHSAYDLSTNAPSTRTVAIVDAYDDPNIESDLGVYSQMFGLPACTTANGCFRKLNQYGAQGAYPAVDSGWAGEIALDVETVHAICQNCDIVLVEASSSSSWNLGVAENAAVAAGADVVTNSFGGPEAGYDATAFNHPGTVIVASAGDSGYGTQYPASSPHVVAVGGTSLSVDGSGGWLGETVWDDPGSGSGTGSGCSLTFAAPSWQSADPAFAATGCGTHRAIADVSADADPDTGIAMYDSLPDSGYQGWMVAGGTSLAAPLIAATYALAGGAHAVNYPAATLYTHQADAPSALHDVTAGANGSCQTLTICTAGPGFDGPTGVGTPDGIAAFVPGAGQTAGGSGGGSDPGSGSTGPAGPAVPPVTSVAPVAPTSPPPGAAVTPVPTGHGATSAQAKAKAKAKARAKAKAQAKARAKAKAKARAKRAAALRRTRRTTTRR